MLIFALSTSEKTEMYENLVNTFGKLVKSFSVFYVFLNR